MIELKFRFTPADGSPPRDVIVKIGDVRETHPGENGPWSASVWIEWSGSGRDHRIRGMDPLHAIESAAHFAAYHLHLYERDGDGTFEPPISEPASASSKQ
jgi:hypothetical protein